DVREVPEVGAAVFLRHGDAQHAELPELAPQLEREVVVGVHRPGDRRDLARDELANGIAQGLDVLAEAEIQSAKFLHCWLLDGCAPRRPAREAVPGHAI